MSHAFSMLHLRCQTLLGQLYNEGCSLARLALGGNTAAMALHNSSAYGQPDTRALIGCTSSVEPLEGLKDLVEVPFIKADAVVFHMDFPEPG